MEGFGSLVNLYDTMISGNWLDRGSALDGLRMINRRFTTGAMRFFSHPLVAILFRFTDRRRVRAGCILRLVVEAAGGNDRSYLLVPPMMLTVVMKAGSGG